MWINTSIGRRAYACGLIGVFALSACEEKPKLKQAPPPRAAPENSSAEPAGPAPEPPPPPPAAPTAYGGEYLAGFSFGGSQADAARSVAVGADGTIAVAGYFSDEVDFGDGVKRSDGGKDAFVACYAADGQLRWVRTFGGDHPVDEDAGQTVAIDAAGNVYATGAFSGTVDLGAGPRESHGRTDFFLVKFDAAGKHLWSRTAGGEFEDRGYSLAIDRTGDLVVTGYFGGVANFGGGTFEGEGRADMFLVKYGADGTHKWSYAYGDQDDDLGRAVDVDWQGNVYVLGDFHRDLDLGGGALTSEGNADVLVAKFSSGGQHQWSRSYGHAFHDFGVDIATDREGNVVFTGSFENEISFGGETFAGLGKKDIFLVKLSTTGEHVWSKVLGAKDDDIGGGVAIDAFGNVALSGWFWQQLDAGGGVLKSAGKADVLLVKYAPDGTHLWSKRFGGKDTEFGRDVAFDAAGNLLLTGTFRRGTDFGGGELPYVDSGMVQRGDAYVVRFGP